jgi:endo-1,4-beta-xylanase
MRYCFYIGLLLNILLLQACKKKAVAPPVQIATLKSSSSFPVGAAISSIGLQNNYVYQGTFITEYNSLTPDYEFKFDQIEQQRGHVDYTACDYIINFALQYHIRVHAHTLIWHQALPAWVLSFSGDSLAWENLFKTHIQTEAAHFKGKVSSWDVVNEAIRDDNGTLRNNDIQPGDGSIWRRHLGPDYIARAFQYAHEADPGALLFYNDCGQEWNGPKLDSMISLVNKLKQRGIPISGIGMQMHTDINVSNNNVTSALQKLAATGLKIHISELDISVNPNNKANIVFTDTLQLAQAAKYQFIAETYRAIVPAAQQYGITTWEFSDHDSWIPAFFNRKDWPLPFDADYRKKPAYYSLLKGLKN